MRFCLVTTFFPPEHFGGDGVFVAHQANLLAEAGHHVEVVHCSDSFQLLRGSVQPSPMVLNPSVIVHRLQSAWGAFSPIATHITGSPYGKPLAAIFQRGFDVIHWHNTSLVGGPGALLLGNAIKLCTLHDYWLICPTSVLYRYNREICTKQECIRCSLSYGRPPQLWRGTSLMSDGLSHIHRFFAPSRYVQQRLLASSLCIQADVLPHFLPEQPRLLKTEPSYYLFAGRLEKLKGLQTILPIFIRSGRRLRVAGSGSYAGELQQMAKDAANIEFLGRIPQCDMPALYAGAIATLVPSLCEETFGLTILESLQQGTPSIVSANGALPETIAACQVGDVFHTETELEKILQRFDRHEEPFVQPDLRQFSPQYHLERYLSMIGEIREGIGHAAGKHSAMSQSALSTSNSQ